MTRSEIQARQWSDSVTQYDGSHKLIGDAKKDAALAKKSLSILNC